MRCNAWLFVRFCLSFSAGPGALLAQPVFYRWDVMVGVGPQAVVTGGFTRYHRGDVAVVTGNGDVLARPAKHR